jgi:hypothetical protein
MMSLAADRGLLRIRTGPKDAALRKARVCYNHLAGDLGVQLYDGLIARGLINEIDEVVSLTDAGAEFAGQFGIELAPLTKLKRPLCRSCLDWSSRCNHLAGSLGTAVLDRIFDLGWASRIEGSRVVSFSDHGEKSFKQTFAV